MDSSVRDRWDTKSTKIKKRSSVVIRGTNRTKLTFVKVWFCHDVKMRTVAFYVFTSLMGKLMEQGCICCQAVLLLVSVTALTGMHISFFLLHNNIHPDPDQGASLLPHSHLYTNPTNRRNISHKRGQWLWSDFVLRKKRILIIIVNIMWGTGKEAIQVEHLFLLSPLYYSRLPWRETIYNHLSLSTGSIQHIFCHFPFSLFSTKRTAGDISIQWENPSNALLYWLEVDVEAE